MRKVEKQEWRQRGCFYCTHRKRSQRCPFEECPYYELDWIDDYEKDYCNNSSIRDIRNVLEVAAKEVKRDDKAEIAVRELHLPKHRMPSNLRRI